MSFLLFFPWVTRAKGQEVCPGQLGAALWVYVLVGGLTPAQIYHKKKEKNQEPEAGMISNQYEERTPIVPLQAR
jgi:hypothetical protein